MNNNSSSNIGTIVTTHSNFKNVNPKIQCNDAESIYNRIGRVLDHQEIFEKYTSLGEQLLWTKDQLENFKINVEKIDRLYYIYEHCSDDLEKYILLCRMEYEDGISSRPIFVKLFYGRKFATIDGDEIEKVAHIFVTFNAELFLHKGNTNNCKNLIHQSLYEDGIVTGPPPLWWQLRQLPTTPPLFSDREEQPKIRRRKRRRMERIHQQPQNNYYYDNNNNNNINPMDFKHAGEILNRQIKFITRTTPQEKSLWTKDKLDNFEIDVEKIDQLYSINHPKDGQCFYMVCRMKHDDDDESLSSSSLPIFVELLVAPEYNNNNYYDNDYKYKTGHVFISFDYKLFMDGIIVQSGFNNNFFCQSLNNDSEQRTFNDSREESRTRGITTHRDFKNIVNNSWIELNDAKTIKECIGQALYRQATFDKRTTPIEMEMSMWTEKEFNNFTIDVEKIDRVYYIERADDERHLELVYRQINEYNKASSFIFVQMNAWNEERGEGGGMSWPNWVGKIFVSTDADLFMNTISANRKYPGWNLILQSLIDDRHIINKNVSSDKRYLSKIKEAKKDYNAWFWEE